MKAGGPVFPKPCSTRTPCTKTYVNWRRENGVKQPRVGTGRSRPALEKDRDLGMIHSRLPAPSLRRHIRAYRFFDLDASRAYTVPAWTRHTMLFRYGDFFYAYFPDGSSVPHLGASLFGATTRPLSYGGTTGRYRFVAVEFRPAVMPALLREHADAFTDCVVEAGAFYGDRQVSLVIEELSEATTAEGRCDVLNRFFEPSLQAKKVEAHPDILEAIGRIDTTTGPPSMGRLAKMSGMSERTLRRRFKAVTGLSPRRYHTVRRVERAMGLIYHGPAAAIDIVTACGFTDQVHLIHELRRYALATPKELRRNLATGPGPLRDFFSQTS